MRIRRTILAPIILVTGSLMAGPAAVALTAAAAPASTAVAVGASPHVMIFHG